MSQVAISGNASGTGVFTIAAPNSNSNYTATLPTATGTLVNTTDTNLTTLTAASASDIAGVNTTATVTSGTTSMTVGSGTGLVAGMFVVAAGITPGTTISTVVGTAVTLSANAGATLSAAPVTFYAVNKMVTPGSIGGQLCRSWVNFLGSSGAIYASFNVSSITRNTTGNYTVNFATAMPDTNYSVAANGRRPSSNADWAVTPRGSTDTGGTLWSTTQCAFISHACTSYTIADSDYTCVQVFR